MASALKSISGGGVKAPGGFVLRFDIDGDAGDFFMLNDGGKSVVAQPGLDKVSVSGKVITFDFDDTITQPNQPESPCHVNVQLHIAPKPSDSTQSWLVTDPDGKVLMDSRGPQKGNYGVKLKTVPTI